MTSIRIRRRISHTVPLLRRYIESDRLQPRLQDIHDLDLIQLKRVLNDNWTNHHRIVRLIAVLMQYDVAWAALIIGNPFERRQKRIYIDRYGDYAQLWEPSNNAIRRSKALFEGTLALLLQRYPEAHLPIRFVFGH